MHSNGYLWSIHRLGVARSNKGEEQGKARCCVMIIDRSIRDHVGSSGGGWLGAIIVAVVVVVVVITKHCRQR